MKQIVESLPEDVKKLIKKISCEDRAKHFYEINSKALDETLADYDFFWQLVILGAICIMCDEDNNFFDFYLDNHIDLMNQIRNALMPSEGESDSRKIEDTNRSVADCKEQKHKLVKELKS